MSKEELLQMLFALEEEQKINTVWEPNSILFYGPDTRMISFNQDVNSQSATSLISQLYHLNHLDTEDTIGIHLNTPGGNLTDALAIYDCITQLPNPVIIQTTGLCASAGLLILSAGDYRVATPNCNFFYHEPVVDGSAITSSSEMNEFASHYANSKIIADKLIQKKAKIKKSIWNKYFEGKTSYWFDSQKALEYNIIDKISESDKIDFKIKT